MNSSDFTSSSDTPDGEGYPFTPVDRPVPAMQPSNRPAAGRPGSVPVERPGGVIAAAVIGYILSAFLFLAGLIILIGASTLDSVVSGLGGTAHSGGLQLLGLANIVAGGLLIAGGVSVSGGKNLGRIMMTAAAAICVLCGLEWSSVADSTGSWAIGFCAPALLAAGFLWQPTVSRWLAARR